MKVRTAIWAAIFSFLFLLSMAICGGIRTVWGADSTMVYVDTCDVYWSQGWGSPYADERAVATCDNGYWITTVRVGQWQSGSSTFIIRRYGGKVSTSAAAIPFDAGADSFFYNQYAQSQMAPALTDSYCLCKADFDCAGGLSTAEWDEWTGGLGNYMAIRAQGSANSWWRWQVEDSCESWFDLDGDNYFGMRTEDDVSANAPPPESAGAWEFRTANYTGSLPYWVFYWTLTIDSNAPDTIKTDEVVSNSWATDTLPDFTCYYTDSRANLDYVAWIISTTLKSDGDMWNSDWQDVVNIAAGNWCEAVTYDGDPLSRAPTWYYVRVKTKNTDGDTTTLSHIDSFRVVSACTVYIPLLVDTESGNTNIDEDDLNPTADFGSWHAGDPASDSGSAWAVMRKWVREGYADCRDSMARFAWLSIAAEPYDSLDNFSEGDSIKASMCIYDTLSNVWGDAGHKGPGSDSAFRDLYGLHYHFYDWNAHVDTGWQYGGLDDDAYDTTEMKKMMARRLYYGKDPGLVLVTRNGWNRETEDLSQCYEDFILLDFTNVNGDHASWDDAPSYPKPYQPKTTNYELDEATHQNRWVGRCEGIPSCDAWMDETFTFAQDSGKAMIGFYFHNFTDGGEGWMKAWLGYFHGILNDTSEVYGIPWIWANPLEAMRFYYGWDDVTAPTFTFSDAGDSIQVLFSEDIFQEEPFAATYRNDSLFIIDFNEVNSTTYRYEQAKFPNKAIMLVCDPYGNAKIDSVTPSELAGERNRLLVKRRQKG